MSASSLTVTKANATTEDEKIASNMFNTSLIFIAGDASQVGTVVVVVSLAHIPLPYIAHSLVNSLFMHIHINVILLFLFFLISL